MSTIAENLVKIFQSVSERQHSEWRIIVKLWQSCGTISTFYPF